MKISKRDKQILLIFAGIVLVFLSFYFVFLPGREKTDKLKAENQKLELRLNELKQLEAQRENFEAEIDAMTNRINGVYDEYQTDFRSEDAFMLGRAIEESSDNTQIAAISVESPEVLYQPQNTDEAATEQAAGTESPAAADEIAVTAEAVELPRPVLYKREIGLSHTCTAQGLKDIIDYITLNTNKMTIETLGVSYDITTGTLIGNTVVNVYLLQGINKEYVPWTIPSVPIGTDDVFGTMELPSNISADILKTEEGGAEEAADGAEDNEQE